MDCSLPGSSVHGIFQAIVLEWIAISFSRGSSQPRDQTQVSRIVDRHFTIWATREVLKKLGIELPCDPAVPLLGIYPKKTVIQKDTCAPMFVAALFTIARTLKQPKCPLTYEWIRRGSTYLQWNIVVVLVTKSCPTLLCPHALQPARLLCSWDFPGKNTRVCQHFLLQGIFTAQGLSPCLLHWQECCLPVSH